MIPMVSCKFSQQSFDHRTVTPSPVTPLPRHCTPLHIAALQSSTEAAEVIVRDSPKVVERTGSSDLGNHRLECLPSGKLT